MNDFPKQIRHADEVRLMAAYFRYLQETSLRLNEKSAASKFEVLADAFDWVCGLDQKDAQKLFTLAEKPLNNILAEEEFRDLEMSKACWLLRSQSLQAIKDQK